MLEALKERVEYGRYGGGVAGTDPRRQGALVWAGKDRFCYDENADVLREEGSQRYGVELVGRIWCLNKGMVLLDGWGLRPE